MNQSGTTEEWDSCLALNTSKISMNQLISIMLCYTHIALDSIILQSRITQFSKTLKESYLGTGIKIADKIKWTVLNMCRG